MAAIAALLITGTVTTTWQWLRASAEKEDATEARQFAEQQRSLAEDSKRQTDHQVAEELFAAGKPEAAVAHLAYLLRQEPHNTVAAERLMSAIWLTDFPRAISPAMQIPGRCDASPDGQLFVGPTSNSLGVRLWDKTGAARSALLRPLDGQDRTLAARRGKVQSAEYRPGSDRQLQ